MKLLIKNALLTCILACLLHTGTFCQSKYIPMDTKNRVFVNGWYLDTLHATPAELKKIHAALKIESDAKLLAADHYYYTYPQTNGDLGVRFKSISNEKMEIYEGNDW